MRGIRRPVVMSKNVMPQLMEERETLPRKGIARVDMDDWLAALKIKIPAYEKLRRVHDPDAHRIEYGGWIDRQSLVPIPPQDALCGFYGLHTLHGLYPAWIAASRLEKCAVHRLQL